MTSTIRSPQDPNTLSNYNKFVTTQTTANFTIDFDEKRLTGNVVLRLKSLNDAETKTILLDTSKIDIQNVSIARESQHTWKLLPPVEPYGSALEITLEREAQLEEILEVNIAIQTTKDCSALQWMTPAQTSNKKHPYMFSQCEAIHARSLFPCQDTPSVKSTVDFNIRSPLPVVASGLPTGARDYQPGKDGQPGTLLYTFCQSIPIPSYLFAIASGDLATASIGPRSTVVASPEELLPVQWELSASMEPFLHAAESLIYPYAWTTYNVLVLPPSFPYGGMENPIFTFATPTLITGDRANVDVIAHELAHSWSGNLVSPSSWEHFWLNEGWTTYIERRIQALIHNEASNSPHFDFSALIGWHALEDSIAQFGPAHPFTALIPNLKGQDPDDAFSSVPYEKGFHFLWHLDRLLTRPKWDRFIPHYFRTFARRSLDSYTFKAELLSFFADDPTASSALSTLDWDTWFYTPGLPPKPQFDTSLADVCYALADKWESDSAGFEPDPADLATWSSSQTVVFLERLMDAPKPLSKEKVKLLGNVYGFVSSSNAEVQSRFLRVGLRAKEQSVCQPTRKLLERVGRIKFVRPLFRQLSEVDRPLALQTYEEVKEFYHPICLSLVEKDLFGKK